MHKKQEQQYIQGAGWNAKEEGKIYTTQTAFVRVFLKKHNISTYEKDSSSAGFWVIEADLGLGLTGQFKQTKKRYVEKEN